MSIESYYTVVFPEESHVKTYAERAATDKAGLESNTAIASPLADLTMVETGAMKPRAVISRGGR